MIPFPILAWGFPFSFLHGNIIRILFEQVVPSLKVSVQISPSPLHLQQFLLRLDVKNQNASESFWLRQVSCTGDRWSLTPLLPPVLGKEAISGKESEDKAAFLSSSVSASQLLPASQTLSLFFKLNVSDSISNSLFIASICLMLLHATTSCITS